MITIIIILGWLLMSIIAFIFGTIPAEYIYLGVSIMLAAQYVSASIIENKGEFERWIMSILKSRQ